MIKQRFGDISDRLSLNSGLQYWLLAAITLFAAALRFYKLGEWSFWIDEIYTINHAQAHFSTIETLLQHIPPHRNWVPISVISTAGILNLVGVSEWSARLASTIIGIISIPLLYFPVRRMFGIGVGLLAALLLAVSPWHLYWSQNARFLTSLLALYLLAALIFFFIMEQDRFPYFFLFLPVFYLAISERLIAIFLIPVIVIYFLLLKILPIENPPGLRARNMLFFILLAIGAVGYETYRFFFQNSSPIADTLATFLGNPIDSPSRLLILILLNIGIPIVSLGFFGGIYLISKKNRFGLFLFINAIVPCLLLVILNPFAFTVDRYAFMTLPYWIILGAVATKEICCRLQNQGKIIAIGILILLLADAASAHLVYFQINHGNRPEWKSALTYVQARREPGDIVVSSVANVSSYYLNEEVMWLNEIDPKSITTSNKNYWFVIDSENGWWATPQKEWVEDHGQLIQVWYLRTKEDMHLRVYYFDPAESEP